MTTGGLTVSKISVFLFLGSLGLRLQITPSINFMLTSSQVYHLIRPMTPSHSFLQSLPKDLLLRDSTLCLNLIGHLSSVKSYTFDVHILGPPLFSFHLRILTRLCHDLVGRVSPWRFSGLSNHSLRGNISVPWLKPELGVPLPSSVSPKCLLSLY